MTRHPAILPVREPCAFALGAIGVPARRWTTRTELYERLDVAKAYLDGCPLEEGALGRAAAEAGLSAHHFLRLFRAVHGITPHQYFASRRLAVAQDLLRRSDRSVAEIACAVGFQSQSAFGRLFKRTTGKTPTAFRHEAIQTEQKEQFWSNIGSPHPLPWAGHVEEHVLSHRI